MGLLARLGIRGRAAMDEATYDFMRRFYRGAEVTNESDRYLLHKLSSLGMVRIGYTIVDGKPIETGRLNEMGRGRYNFERTMRSTIRRGLYMLMNVTAW